MKMTSIEKRFVNGRARQATVARNVMQLLERVPLAPGWRILDVGCGVGSAASAIAARGDLDVIGVDVDRAQIAAAQEACSLPNLHFMAMDGTAIDFDDATFDVVSSSMATHHIPRWQRALAEMARVLRPGGYLVYIDFVFPAWLARCGRFLAPLMALPSKEAIARFALQSGLSQVHEQKNGLQWHVVYRKSDGDR